MTSGAVVVTGAAGGIGAAICGRFRSRGHYVIGLDRETAESADESIVVDLADLSALRTVLDDICKRHELAAVVHNAALQPLFGAGETTPETYLQTLAVNVVAADVLVAACRASLERQGGSIVVVSSVHAVATTGGINAYATSKAALEGWVRASAIDLGPSVRVNAVRPGAIDTSKLRDGFARWEASAESRLSELMERTPLRRIGTVDDVAFAVDFLASDSAGFITGTTLVVDGGATARLGTE
ncbi:MAG: SDR family NAD(P)-dependent oxidoreductase [Aeromicrobium sp.]